MMRNTSLEQTIQAKVAFERELAKYNMRVTEHRADNGRFADVGFKAKVEKCNQTMSYCGVGAHYQNGFAKNYIGKITTRARVMLLHAKRFWPEAITPILWPFAVAQTIEIENTLVLDSSGRSALQKLTTTDAPIALRDQHTWRYLVYVLEGKA